eukprot:SAG31_NODE_4789_length_2955_cov_1.493347_1_plen_83_part_10
MRAEIIINECRRMCSCKIAVADLSPSNALFAASAEAKGSYRVERPSAGPVLDSSSKGPCPVRPSASSSELIHMCLRLNVRFC